VERTCWFITLCSVTFRVHACSFLSAGGSCSARRTTVGTNVRPRWSGCVRACRASTQRTLSCTQACMHYVRTMHTDSHAHARMRACAPPSVRARARACAHTHARPHAQRAWCGPYVFARVRHDVEAEPAARITARPRWTVGLCAGVRLRSIGRRRQRGRGERAPRRVGVGRPWHLHACTLCATPAGSCGGWRAEAERRNATGCTAGRWSAESAVSEAFARPTAFAAAPAFVRAWV
jgi:hypothetical protein